MTKHGFIGTGVMGKMLIKRFLDSGLTQSEQIYASNRSPGKLEKIVSETEINRSANQDVIRDSDIIYLCVKPQDLPEIYSELRDKLEGKILVTCIAAVESDAYYQNLGDIELIRIIPSITNKRKGTILFTSGKNVKSRNKEKIYSDLSTIANVYEVEENHIDKYTHLASCSPAIISTIIEKYLNSVIEKGIDKKLGKEMILDALYHTAILLKEDGFGIIDEVCTPCGISRIGVDFVNKKFPINELTEELLGRMKTVKQKCGGKY